MKMRQAIYGLATGVVAACIVAGYCIGRARADGAPLAEALTYSGFLEDGNGPVEGSKNLSLRLYAAKSGGTEQCSVDAGKVELQTGRFSIPLDDPACAQAIHDKADLWVELAVDGTVLPRAKLGAVPYALEAQRAAEATGPLREELDALKKQANDPECPAGYARDGAVSERVICQKGSPVYDEVVRVGRGPGAFWIDRYEASVWNEPTADSGALAGVPWGASSDDYPLTFPDTANVTSSSKLLYAASKKGVQPSAFMTWFQTNLACVASGKRLPTGPEWLAAAAGTVDPGASSGANGACNTQSASVRKTGAINASLNCASVWGAEDMIGNLWEMTAEWYAGVGNTADPALELMPWPDGVAYGDDRTWHIASEVYNGIANTKGAPSMAERGGSKVDGSMSGIFALNLADGPARIAYNQGIRCVLAR